MLYIYLSILEYKKINFLLCYIGYARSAKKTDHRN